MALDCHAGLDPASSERTVFPRPPGFPTACGFGNDKDYSSARAIHMQTIKINLKNITEEQIDLIVDYLKRGRVLAYPTDTIYGLGCDARDAEAVEKIKKIKGRAGERIEERENEKTKTREASKAMLILVSDYEMLKRYCYVSAEQLEYLKKVWGVEEPHPTLSFVRRGEIFETKIKLQAELFYLIYIFIIL